MRNKTKTKYRLTQRGQNLVTFLMALAAVGIWAITIFLILYEMTEIYM